MFRELKPSGGQLRGRQKAWQWRLREAGQDAGEWRPADWNDGTIAAELAALNGQNTQVGREPDPVRAFYRALYGNRPVSPAVDSWARAAAARRACQPQPGWP
jgi:hypothetical protein